MTLHYQAAVLHEARGPLQIETVTAAPLAPSDVLVRVRAAGLCHTDLEVIDGSLRFPMPIVLGHEAAGVVEDVGSANDPAAGVRRCPTNIGGSGVSDFRASRRVRRRPLVSRFQTWVGSAVWEEGSIG
jgi:threonine dehydrogenase-like Zn-dependent dehydrogenase